MIFLPQLEVWFCISCKFFFCLENNKENGHAMEQFLFILVFGMSS